MWTRILFGMLFLVLLMSLGKPPGFPWTENRFDMRLEYELLNVCMKRYEDPGQTAMDVCICTLRRTMENGWGPDFDNTRDFMDDSEQFTEDYGNNLMACRDEKG